MRLRFLAIAFVVGFVVRVVFALAILLRMQHDREAGTLHYMDAPTLFVAHVLERAFPSAAGFLDTGPPVFLRWNLIGSVVWGLIFMSLVWLFMLIVKPGRRLR